VKGGTPANFSSVAQSLVGGLLQQIAEITHIPVADLASGSAAAPAPAMRERLQVVAEAARLTYLGRVDRTEAPDIVRGWTTDKDLADTSKTSLEPRLLLSRNQVSDLATALKEIVRTGRANRISPQNVFSQLRSAFAAAARGERIARAATLGGMLGEYLEDLPYQSQILQITEADWLAAGRIEQDNKLAHVESCIAFYEDRQGRPDAWFDISHSGQPGEAVTPIPLEQLP
jgi:hypothetical protein